MNQINKIYAYNQRSKDQYMQKGTAISYVSRRQLKQQKFNRIVEVARQIYTCIRKKIKAMFDTV